MAIQLQAWEQFDEEKLEKVLATNLSTGLSAAEVRSRQGLRGKNVLTKEKEWGIFGKVLKQFQSPLVLVLLLAAFVTLFLREFIDATVIGIALFINVVVGTFQEERASRAFERLNESQEHFAAVFRNGRKIVIPTEELVTGDVVELESGSYVPADTRILQEKDLSINEAALTGEWIAVAKSSAVLTQSVPLAEQVNMAWMGTLVTHGYGRGVVVAIGNQTQVGQIAKQLGAIDESVTPLQQSIRRVMHFIAYSIGTGIIVIFGLGILRGVPVPDMLFMSIALAVAAIPSGLPAAVTVVLALGMETILRRGGLVRNLLAAETLGATTIILTDKTGTLTEAKMKLASLYTLDTLKREGREGWSDDDRALLQGAVLASDAFVEENAAEEKEEQRVVVHGRPIERAIILAGLDAGLSQRDLFEKYGRIDYLQFASKRRFGASLNRHAGRTRRLYLTGSPEYLLEHSTYVYRQGRPETLTGAMRQSFASVQEKRSAEGMRFIGVACKDVHWHAIPEKGEEENEIRSLTDELVFLGFLSFEDPVRVDVADAISEVKGAGARVIMVTGDNPETAGKIACDVGISCEADDIRRGADIDGLSDEELYEELTHVKVLARTLPQQKLRIARVLKNRGEVVAMTGDGINDAPALRSANIGIAVGSGTEVAKEASDMVLLNNSFAVIVAAVAEGRKIIDNLTKIIAYLLSTSFSGITVVGGALIAGAPLPLLPAQLLWANIIEEGLMSFAFAFEKKEPGIMKRNPRTALSRGIMTRELKQLIVIVAGITSVFLIALFFILLRLGLPIEEVRTIMFVALSLDAIFFSFSMKSLDTPLWRIDPFSNRYLLVALAVSIALLILAVTWGPLQLLLTLVPLALWEVVLLAGVGIFNLAVIEGVKYLVYARKS